MQKCLSSSKKMTTINKNNITLPFASFYEHLASKGFTITIDHYLRTQIIIDSLGKERSIKDLKYLIAPVISTKQSRQKSFYEEYDAWFHSFPSDILSNDDQALDKKITQHSQDDNIKPSKKYYALTAVFLILISIFGLIKLNSYLSQQSNQKTDFIVKETVTTTSSDEKDLSPVSNNTDAPEENKKLEDEQKSEQSKEKNDILSFFKKYLWLILRSGLFILSIVYLLIKFYEYNKQQLVLQKTRDKKPWYSYPIKVDSYDPEFVTDKNFYTTARRLRDRQKSNIYKIDIQKTLTKTINSGGFPHFEYSALKKAPEYLVLIDLPEYRDHYSYFIKHITDRFEKEEINVNKLFYKEDPQICFKDLNSPRENLSDIIYRFKGSRLIIVGNGNQLLDQSTGELEEWTELFDYFQERAILSTRPTEEWGICEVNLSKNFVVLPASLNGFDSVVDHFQSEINPNILNPKHDNDIDLEIQEESIENINYLKKELGDEFTFQWLCACSVYPELHWNLTLYLAKYISTKPLKEDSVIKLINLTWFRTGAIPDNIRLELIKHLDKERLITVRQAIIELFEKNPPSEYSELYDSYRLNIALQKWMLTKDPEQKKEIQSSITDEKQIMQDYTILRLLSSIPESPLNFILPKKLRQLFFKNAIPLLGLKEGAKLFKAALISLLIILMVLIPDIIRIYKHYQTANPKIDITEPEVNTTDTDQKKITDEAEPKSITKNFEEKEHKQEDNQSIYKSLLMPTEPEKLTKSIYESLKIDKSKIKKQTDLGSLLVITEPKDARVRIMNIKPVYEPNMSLKNGDYLIEVSKPGYKKQEKNITIKDGENKELEITLEKLFRLNFTVIPQNASIRCIEPEIDFKNGMWLEKKVYKLEFTASGYYNTIKEITIDNQDLDLSIELKPLPRKVTSFSNNLGMSFVLIKAGTFMMGSPPDEPGREKDEVQHKVTISKDYYMQTTEVTQGQWKAVMGNNPSRFKECGDNCPVEQISWEDAQRFIEIINKNGDEYLYRLPTEAEWEYAARAGTKTALYNGKIEILGYNNAPALYPIAWYGGNSCVNYNDAFDCSSWSEKQYKCAKCGTHPVAQKQPNSWGLYDTLGNVYEWCFDWYGEYPTNPVIDPKGVKSGSSRLLRGGSWDNDAGDCRSADRVVGGPGFRISWFGVRLAASLSSAKEQRKDKERLIMNKKR